MATIVSSTARRQPSIFGPVFAAILAAAAVIAVVVFCAKTRSDHLQQKKEIDQIMAEGQRLTSSFAVPYATSGPDAKIPVPLQLDPIQLSEFVRTTDDVIATASDLSEVRIPFGTRLHVELHYQHDITVIYNGKTVNIPRGFTEPVK